MLGPEAEFDEDNPADYSLFGVRYLLLPTGMPPAVPAQKVMANGPYSLWQINDDGYVELVSVTGTLVAEPLEYRQRVGNLAGDPGARPGLVRQVAGVGGPPEPSRRTVRRQCRACPPPGPWTTCARPHRGLLSADVNMARPGVLLASVAFDPGWHAWVDGHPVTAGNDGPGPRRYPPSARSAQCRPALRRFRLVPQLWAASLLSLVAMAVLGRRWEQRHLERSEAAPHEATGPVSSTPVENTLPRPL